MTENFDYRQLSLIAPPCSLCEGLAFEKLARCDRYGFGLTTVGCRRCGLVQTRPRPSDVDVDRFYRESYRRFYQAVSLPDADYIAHFGKTVRLRHTSERLLRLLENSESARLLDIGCGEGSLFSALRDSGYRGGLYGIEPDARFADFARLRGAVDVYPSLTDLQASGILFESVVLNHVLEHFPQPRAVLTSIRELLTPTGRLYVDVPDAECYGSVNDLHIAHLLHFDRVTLDAMLRSAGFTVSQLEAHCPPHHPPSIYAIALPSRADSRIPTATTSAASWQAVRSIQRNAWRWTLRRNVARLPGVKSLWRALRSFAGLSA